MDYLTYSIDSSVRGMSRQTGFGTKTQDGQERWNLIQDVVSRDGALVAGWADGGGPDAPSVDFNLAQSTDTGAQSPRYVSANCVVTTRDVYIWQTGGSAGWVNATPIYYRSTASCAGGTAVTGVAGATGTLWSTCRIKAGMLMRWPSISSTWYMIDAVNSDSSITLTSNGPTTLGSIAYEIRRCFGGNAEIDADEVVKNRIFAQEFNGDLYIAGNAVDGEFPAVLYVPNVYVNTAVDPYDSQYLLAQSDVKNSDPAGGAMVEVPVKSRIAELKRIFGLQVDQDGRVNLATQEEYTVGAATSWVLSRFRWCSLDDLTEWNSDPAGFTDLVGINPASWTGLGRLGNTLTAHFHNGILLGVPTGQRTPPYTWSPSSAQVGTAAPETLCSFGGAEYFVGADSNIYMSGGGNINQIADETARDLMRSVGVPDVSPASKRASAFGTWAIGYDGESNSLSVFQNWRSLTWWGSFLLQIDLVSNDLKTYNLNAPATCVSFIPASSIGSPVTVVAFPTACVYAYTGADDVTDYLRYMTAFGSIWETSGEDDNITPALTSESRQLVPTLTTGWIDFGDPLGIKTLSSVEIEVVPEGTASGGSSNALILSVESRPLEASATGTSDALKEPKKFTSYVAQFNDPGLGGAASFPTRTARVMIDPTPDSAYQAVTAVAFRLSVEFHCSGFLRMIVKAIPGAPAQAVDYGS